MTQKERSHHKNSTIHYYHYCKGQQEQNPPSALFVSSELRSTNNKGFLERSLLGCLPDCLNFQTFPGTSHHIMKYVLLVTAVAVAVCRFRRISVTVTAFSFSPLTTRLSGVDRRTACGWYQSTTLYPLAMTSGNEEDNDDDEYNFSYNPIDHETPEERESRMKLVRQLQKSFYKDEEGPTLSVAAMETSSSQSSSTDATIISNLPLWRVQWTELPGSQNVLNVHVPHYTNMFQKILKGKSREWGDDGSDDGSDDDSQDDADVQHHYFGHIFLPGGSENLDDPSYALQVGDIGTLMTISDARQQSDGRLTLIVQALERFEIRRVERSHSPYAIADVAILPDSEHLLDVAGLKITIDDAGIAAPIDNASTSTNNSDSDSDSDKQIRALAVSEAFANHPFEYRRVSIDECEITSDDGTVVGLGVSPLSNYDATKQLLLSEKSNTDIDNDIDIDTDDQHRDLVAIAESQVWIQLDELLKLLRIASNGVGVPVPTQLMGLLPRSRSVSSQDTAAVVAEPWPEKFDLERLATNFEDQSGTVGTHSKSPFVRVDEKNSNDSNENDGSHKYSSLRRAQRLSYVVWTLSESIALPPEPGSSNSNSDGAVDMYGRETILAITSTQERLELATEKMNKICLLLKKILRLEDK